MAKEEHKNLFPLLNFALYTNGTQISAKTGKLYSYYICAVNPYNISEYGQRCFKLYSSEPGIEIKLATLFRVATFSKCWVIAEQEQ